MKNKRPMNIIHRILNVLTAKRHAKENSRLKISNLSRRTELASHAEVAGSGAARNKGLLGRTSLPPGTGLWIVPCESVHTFFMKFPIDLVYIDRKKRVKKVRSNVPPWRLSACLSAHSIIELPAGTVHGSQTAPGDMLEFTPTDPEADATFSTPELI
jgi:uncharacterized protein